MMFETLRKRIANWIYPAWSGWHHIATSVSKKEYNLYMDGLLILSGPVPKGEQFSAEAWANTKKDLQIGNVTVYRRALNYGIRKKAKRKK